MLNKKMMVAMLKKRGCFKRTINRTRDLQAHLDSVRATKAELSRPQRNTQS